MQQAMKGKEQTRQPAQNRTSIPVQKRISPADTADVRLQYTAEAPKNSGLEKIFLHRHSGQPALYGADAMIQGRHIFVAPGQDAFIPHELAHLELDHPRLAEPAYTENGMGVCLRPDWEYQADRLAGTLEISSYSFVESDGGAPAAGAGPLLLHPTAHEAMIARYKNQTRNKPVEALKRKNFSDYQRMLYWLDYAIASRKEEERKRTAIPFDQLIQNVWNERLDPWDSIKEILNISFAYKDIPSVIDLLRVVSSGNELPPAQLIEIIYLALDQPEYYTTVITSIVKVITNGAPELPDDLIDKLQDRIFCEGEEIQQRYQTAIICEILRDCVKESVGVKSLLELWTPYKVMINVICQNGGAAIFQNLGRALIAIVSEYGPPPAQGIQALKILANINADEETKLLIFERVKHLFYSAIALIPKSVKLSENLGLFNKDNCLDQHILQLMTKEYLDIWDDNLVAETILDYLSQQDKTRIQYVLLYILQQLAEQSPAVEDSSEEYNTKALICIWDNPELRQSFLITLDNFLSSTEKSHDESGTLIKRSMVRYVVSRDDNLRQDAILFYRNCQVNGFERASIQQYLLNELGKRSSTLALLNLLHSSSGSMLYVFLTEKRGVELIRQNLSLDIWNLFKEYCKLQEGPPILFENTITELLNIYGAVYTGEDSSFLLDEYESVLFQQLKDLIAETIKRLASEQIPYLKADERFRLMQCIPDQDTNTPDFMNAVLEQGFSEHREIVDKFFPAVKAQVFENGNWNQHTIIDLFLWLAQDPACFQHITKVFPLNEIEQEYYSRYDCALQTIRHNMIQWPRDANSPHTFHKIMKTLHDMPWNFAEPDQLLLQSILANYEMFAKRPGRQAGMSLASIQPRHIIPYSDIKGLISVLFSNNPCTDQEEWEKYRQYQKAAKKAIKYLINILAQKNQEKSNGETGYDIKIKELWLELSPNAFSGLVPSIRSKVAQLIPLLANHPCNIFMGDGPQNMMLGNRLDYGKEGIAMYEMEYIDTLRNWWFSILTSLEMNPHWNDEDHVFESELSRDIVGDSSTLDQWCESS